MTDLAAVCATRGQGDPGIRTWVSAVVKWGVSWPDHAAVLEVGSSSADWIGWAHRLCPGITITALDWRGPKAGAGRRLKGDVLAAVFQPAEFDVIAFISAIEHIGLGHYSADPLDVDGDSHAFARCVGWLKPGGFLYADVPHNPSGYRVFGTKCRIYDDAAINTRFTHPQMTLEHRAYMDLSGNLIPNHTIHRHQDGGHPYIYCANLWRKDTTDGT